MAWPDGLTWLSIGEWWNGSTWWDRLDWLVATLIFVVALGATIRRWTLSDRPTSKLNEIREKSKARDQALAELETHAGIAEAAEKLRGPMMRLYQRGYETAENKSRQKRLRQLYFTVPDAGLRKELIEKHCEAESLAMEYWEQDFYNVATRLKTARSVGKNWWFAASIWGIIFIGLGFHFFGQVGAIAGLLVGYFRGRRVEDDAIHERESAIAEAERDLKEAEQFWNEARNQPQTFSRQEARTGEPEPDSRLRAV